MHKDLTWVQSFSWSSCDSSKTNRFSWLSIHFIFDKSQLEAAYETDVYLKELELNIQLISYVRVAFWKVGFSASLSV